MSIISDNVSPLFAEQQPEPDINPSFTEMARAVAQICATRILLLIAVITGSAIWGYTIFDPAHDRIAAAIAFSLVFVLPQTLLYFKRG